MFTLTRLQETSSTNEYLKDLAKSGSPSGTAVSAEIQTKGKGSRGRSFVSPAGGLYVSLLWDLNIPGTELAYLTKVSAAAVRRVLKKSCGIDTAIKPVNDIYYKGRKICGILCESVSFRGVTRSIIGIGINVNTNDDEFPPDIRDEAGSIKALTGKAYDIDALTASLLDEFEDLLGDYENRFDTYIKEYEKWSVLQKQY